MMKLKQKCFTTSKIDNYSVKFDNFVVILEMDICYEITYINIDRYSFKMDSDFFQIDQKLSKIFTQPFTNSIIGINYYFDAYVYMVMPLILLLLCNDWILLIS